MNWYWNKNNFEGLKEIAQAIVEEEYLLDYRKYLILREKGLRKQALDTVRQFVDQMITADFELQKKFTDWILYTEWANRKVHQLIPHPLFEGVIKPCLQKWKKEENNPIPYRWAGIFMGEQESLEKARLLDKDEQISRYTIISRTIESIEYDTHHLPEYYIGEPQGTLDIGQRAKIVIDELHDPIIRKRFLDDLEQALQLVQDWCEFKRAGSENFDQWCRNLGRNYEWIKAYYYDA